jgi:hypothetical protein
MFTRIVHGFLSHALTNLPDELGQGGTALTNLPDELGVLLGSYVDQLILGQLHVVLHYDGPHSVPLVNQIIGSIPVCGERAN